MMTNKLQKEFPYKTSFSSSIKCLIEEEKSKFLSTASVNNLQKIIPSEFFGDGYQDLLPIASNLAAIGLKNKNDDSMTIATAVKIYKSLIHKQLNSEHSRANIIGHIINAGFSKFNSEYILGAGSEIVNEQEALDSDNGVVNLCYAAVLYKVAHPKLIEEIIECSIPNSSKYLDICSSWEVGFADYNIAVGSPVIKEAEIITPDNEHFNELKALLTANGGAGKKGDQYVYRIVTGDPIFLGGGLTYNPASQVKGVTTALEIKEEIEAKAVETITLSSEPEVKTINLEKKQEKTENIISHISKPDVITINKSKKTMKFKSINELNDDNLKEATASSIKEIFEEEILKKSKEWSLEKEAKENELKQAKADTEALKVSKDKFENELKQVKADLEAIRNEAAAKQAEESYNQRMASFDEEYELDEDTRQILASDLKDMSDEGFEAYAKKMKVMLKDKNKELKKAKEDKEKKEVVASVATDDKKDETIVAAAVDGATVTNVSANTSTASTSLKDKYKAAFEIGNGVEITESRKNKNKE